MGVSQDVHMVTAEHVASSYGRMQTLAGLAMAGWTGEAGGNFQSALKAWMGNYKTVTDVLERMRGNANAPAAMHGEPTQGAKQVATMSTDPIGLPGF
jgi:uncharacterized protein YukE